jgi:hypothetical protein
MKNGGENLKPRQKYFLIGLLVVIGLLYSGLPVMAADLTDCSKCHYFSAKPTADVTKFELPPLYDGSVLGSPVDKTTCKVCHLENLADSTHSFTLTVVSVSGVVYGSFSTPESIYMTPDRIHYYHNGISTNTTGPTCMRCHGVVSCQSCHSSSGHTGHYTGTGVNPNTGQPIGTPVLRVVNGSFNYVDGNSTAYWSLPTTCAASECHQPLPAPKRYRTGGSALCYNCHTTDKAGHTATQLLNLHGTAFSGQLTFTTQLTGTYTVDCTGCHNNVLDVEHTNRNKNCLSCHKSNNRAVIDVVYKAKGVIANRACEKCHFNPAVLAPPVGMAPSEHKQFHIATQSDNLRVDGAPHANCNTCHQRQTLLPAIATLANSTIKNYSCLTCHTGTPNPRAPLHKADYNGELMGIMDVHTNCAVCHTPGSASASAVNTVIGKLKTGSTGYSCVECHPGLSAGHKATFETVLYPDVTTFHAKCTNCHNAAYKTTVASLKNQVKLGVGYNCSACHAVTATKGKTPYYPGHMAGNDGVVGFHPKNACITCHGTTKQVDGTKAYNINLSGFRLKLPTPGYACVDCHNGTVTLNGLKANKPFHQAMDDNGAVYQDTTQFHPTCGACHNSVNTDVKNVITLNRGTITPYKCSDCHRGGLAARHNANFTYVTGTVNSAVYTAVYGYETTRFHRNCGQCHNSPNPAVYPKLKSIVDTLKVNPAATYQCADCHGGVAGVPAAQHKSPLTVGGQVYEATVFHVKTGTQAKDQCFTCHGNQTVAADLSAIITKVKGGQGYLCTDCHKNAAAAPYKPNHSATLGIEQFNVVNEHPACLTCHTTAADAQITPLKGKTGYSCEACHTNLTARHQSTTDLTNPSGMVNCSWCHSSTDPLLANNNLIGVHIKPNIMLTKQYNCNVCHSLTSPVRTQIASKKTACEACHNGIAAPVSHPDSQYYPRHVVNPLPSFMPEYKPNCSSCHTNNSVITLHADPKISVGCKTCHYTAAYKPAVVSLSADCRGCHSKSVNPVMDMTATHDNFHNVNVAVYQDSAGCLSCHMADSVIASVYTVYSSVYNLLPVHQKKPAYTKVANCDACHGITARTEVKTAIANNNVNCVACHGGAASGHQHPVAANGYDASPTSVSCARCHATSPDGTAELAAIHRNAASAGKISNYSCSTCHNATFEGTGKVIVKDGVIDMKQNGTTPIYCASCHNGTLAHAPGLKYPAHEGNHINSSGYGIYKGTYNGVAFDDSGADCSKCHASLNTKVVHDTAVHSNVNCNSCHLSANPAVQSVITGAWSRSATKAAYTCASCHNTLPYLHKPEHIATSADTAALNCAGCHGAASWTGNNAQVAGVHKNNCNTCHASANSVVSNFIVSRKGLINPVYSCEGCHTTGGAKTKEAVHQPEHLAKYSATNMNCSSCHGFTEAAGTPTDIKSATVHKNGCNTCHGPAVRSDVKLVVAAKKGQLNPVYNCEDCHGIIHLGWENKHKPVLPATPSLQCANCHNNYLPAEHTRYFGTVATSVGYKVYRSDDGGVNFRHVGSTTGTGYSSGSLKPSTNYYFRVQAYDPAGNHSAFSTVVSAITPATSVVSATLKPGDAQYGENIDADISPDSNIKSLSPSALTRLTDGKDSNGGSYDVTVLEKGNDDEWIYVRLNNYDAKNYASVKLMIRASWKYSISTGDLWIYPYKSDGLNIDPGARVTYNINNPSNNGNFTNYTIDVTSAARKMDGYGWLKFRIKPGSLSKDRDVRISEVRIVLDSSTAQTSTTTPDSTLTPVSSNDVTPPTVPGNLTAKAFNPYQIDLAWTASTDQGPTVSESATCVLCHGSTTTQRAKDAVTGKNANCSACHNLHGDITTIHTGNALPTTPWKCGTCHTNILSIEHSAGAVLKQNSVLNCDTCHRSGLTKVRAAIKSTVTDKSNLNCGSCHTGTSDGVGKVHGDIAAPHLAGIFPLQGTDADCLKCHIAQAAEFVSTKGAYHVVNGLTSKSTIYGSYVSPWTNTSIVTCRGCHGDNNDGKAQAANILKRPYTYASHSGQADMLCFLCHDRITYGAGSNSTGKTGFSNGSKNFHNDSDHKINNVVQCSWCHAAVPHATSRAHLIVTRTEPNSAGNLTTNFTHPASGNYQKSSCGSDSSLCSDHRGY